MHKLLTESLAKYVLRLELKEGEVAHMLLPREGVVYTYVVENDKKEITDFVSFYRLPS